MPTGISVDTWYALGNLLIDELPAVYQQNAMLSLRFSQPGQLNSVIAQVSPLINWTLPSIVIGQDGFPALINAPPGYVPPADPIFVQPVISTMPALTPAPVPPTAVVATPSPTPVAVLAPAQVPAPSGGITATGILSGINPEIQVASPFDALGTPAPSVPGTLDAAGNVICPSGYVSSPTLRPRVEGSTVSPEVMTLLDSAQVSVAPAPSGCQPNPNLSTEQFVTANDFIVVSLWNTYVCPTVTTVNARVLDCSGQIRTYSRSLSQIAYTRFNAPVAGSICMQLADGFLMSVQVSTSASFVAQGHIWTIAEIRSGGCSGIATATLFQDYLQFGKTLGWPGGNQLSVGDGPGTSRFRNFSYDTGGGFTDTWQVPDGCLGLCRQIVFNLTTSAAAGNRQVYIRYVPPEGASMFIGSFVDQPPSTSFGYCFAPNVDPHLNAGFFIGVPIPDNMWNAGAGGIDVEVNNPDAGDHMDAGGVAFQMWSGPTVAF